MSGMMMCWDCLPDGEQALGGDGQVHVQDVAFDAARGSAWLRLFAEEIRPENWLSRGRCQGLEFVLLRRW